MKIFGQSSHEKDYKIVTSHFEDSSLEDINSMDHLYGQKRCSQSIHLSQDELKFSSNTKSYATQFFENIIETIKLRNLIIGFTTLKYAPIVRCSS